MQFQFQYLYLNKNKNVWSSNIERENSNVYCNGLELNKGKLMRDCKMYYHFEREINNNNNNNKINSKYFKRLQLLYFECKSMEKTTMINKDSSVLYEESLIDICQYLAKFWEINKSSTRISICVRIIGKSMIFDNVIYICDNSLLINIQSIPLINDNKQLFESVMNNLNNANNEWLYLHQPLIILRDIATCISAMIQMEIMANYN